MRLIDLTGHRYGRLTVIGRAGYYKKELLWHCICDCGNEVNVIGSSLKRGNTRSCGCIHREAVSKYDSVNGRLYRIWADMKTRCNNPKYKLYHHYGGRGIKVCPMWNDSFSNFSLWAFENGYSDNLTIDRIDVDGNYEPSNCRWISIQAQQWNRRDNVVAVYEGKRYTLKQLSELSGISISTLYTRLRLHNWNVAEAVETPVSRNNKKHGRMQGNEYA